MAVRIDTLIYLVDGKNKKVLLIHKKRGFGKEYINAPGGKCEEGETPEECAIRECFEEVNVTPKMLEWMGILEFLNNDGEDVIYCHVFLSKDWEGEIKESDEAIPKWYKFEEIPYEKMWPEDKIWLPKILKGKKILGKFRFVDWKFVEGSEEIYEIRLLR